MFKFESAPSKNESENISTRFREEFKYATGTLTPEKYDEFRNQKYITEEHNGTTYTFKLRGAKHARLVFLTIQKENEAPLECVLRDVPRVGEAYTLNIKQKKAIQGFVPDLYAIENGWVVMERLHGLEYGTLTERLKEDSKYRALYAKNASDTLYKLASAEIFLTDIGFLAGHNTMADPTQANIRSVEQDCAIPEYLGRTPDEIITKQLESELEIGNPRKNIKEYEIDFLFQFFKNILTKVNPEKLSVRPIYFKPSHPGFRMSLDLENSLWDNDRISDAEYALMVEKNTAELKVSSGYKINTELVHAVQDNNIEKFSELLQERKIKENLLPEEIKKNILS